MVKGVSKRVVVVRCPETKYFDEAIFMVREEAMEGLCPEQVLREACKVADQYVKDHTEKKAVRWEYVSAGVMALVAAATCIVLFL